MRRYAPLFIAITLFSPLFAQSAHATTITPAFVRRWAHDDAAIASGEEQRSWTWGPRVVRSGTEAYVETPGGQRQVWYFDKARMEISHPEADPDDAWYVTTGLLVRELIGGEMQLGDGTYEAWQPAAVPVAGDLEVSPDQTITYADLRAHASINGDGRVPMKDAGQSVLTDILSPGGVVSQDAYFATYAVRTGAYDDVVGHNIAQVFLDALPAETLLYVAGRPLTEPFWARVLVAQQQRDVLLQAFERRVLTYTPANPEQWRVEWGNVGRQYLQWRYGQVDDGTGFDPNASVDASAVVHELRALSPAAHNIALNRQGLVGAAVYQLDTGTIYSFQGTRAFPMYSTVKVPIMLAVLDRAVREGRRVSAWEQDLITAMIKVSDNGAASQLLADIGGARAVNQYLRRVGITNTEINGYAWGASTTTAQDMARLMARLGSCTILVQRLCNYALATMQAVVRGQKWGVSAGAPDPAGVALKNGWYPQSNGWGVNSIGLVTGGGKQYAIAVYTNPNSSMAYGIETIEGISREIAAASFGGNR